MLLKQFLHHVLFGTIPTHLIDISNLNLEESGPPSFSGVQSLEAMDSPE